MTARRVAISALWLALLVLCWPPVKTAVSLGWDGGRDVQMFAAPLFVMFLMYWERNRIFAGAAWNVRVGAPLLAVAVPAYLFLRFYGSGGPILTISVAILVSLAAFILCFGLRSFRAACFPLGCLLLMIPVPDSAMDKITAGLQHGSAAVSFQMLRLAGIPVFAEGMRMSLKGLEIEVAPECSGIRSCLALALLGLLAGRVCLRSGWNCLALVVATIPIAILKNALRISVLSSLAAYVNPAFLYGRLHQYGGLVFTPLGVVLFVALLAALQRYEAWEARRRTIRFVANPAFKITRTAIPENE
jgi:exosortase